MTAKRDLASRMAVAASRRAEPGTPVGGETAVRTKPVRITLDLSPADYAALNRWLAAAGPHVDPDNPPRITAAAALRAMLKVITSHDISELAVIDLLRRERGQ